MKADIRRNLPGEFLARDLGEGSWRLSSFSPGTIEVVLRGVQPGAADILRLPKLGDIDIEWRHGTAALTLSCAARRATIEARSAIVHEPLPRLYEALPLARIDARARRFWANVFRLLRIPGGRYLLGYFARRPRR